MMPTSAIFQNTMIERLLYLSAITPASGENRKNGVIKHAVTIETSNLVSMCGTPTNRTSMSVA